MTDTGAGFAITFDPNSGYENRYFSIILSDGSDIVEFVRVRVYIASLYQGVNVWNLYNEDDDMVCHWDDRYYENDVEIFSFIMKSEYPANAEYYVMFGYSKDGTDDLDNRVFVEKAVVGHYNTLAAAASQPDIKDKLFPENYEVASRYKANFSGTGRNFTVFAEGEVYKITIRAVDAPVEEYTPGPNPGSEDTYFQIEGAVELHEHEVYILPYQHDSYYDFGYQTVFFTDDIDLTEFTPLFWSGGGAKVFAGRIGAPGAPQVSGVTVRDFSDEPIQYVASAENGVGLKNYWVTFVPKHKDGAKLFVNGINGETDSETGKPKREVFLTSIHDNIHDIFIANVGDDLLTGLAATLKDPVNIKLDPYWTVGGEGNDTLAAFDEVQSDYFGELANVAKIRLVPEGEGDISGTLVISAECLEEDLEIILTGSAGDPKLTTSEIPKAVKYVPYSVQIMNNNKYSWNRVSLSVTSGRLPLGVELKPNGELYGAPREAGIFNFRVQMTNSDSRFRSSSVLYTLVVEENTNANVRAASDHEIITEVPATITSYRDYTFEVDNAYSDFVAFFLDGDKLAEGVDYVSAEGSTRITIRSQTLSKAGTGTHTIAAEFRVEGKPDNDMTKAAQNYTSMASLPPGGNPAVESPISRPPDGATSQPPVTPERSIFTDVSTQDWFAAAVKFVYEEGLFKGTSETAFSPRLVMSRAMMVTVLFRMDDAEPTGGNVFSDVMEGAWYAEAVNWAAANSVVNGVGNSLFAPNGAITREEMAVILHNYCKFKSIVLPNASAQAIADAQFVSEWALEAVSAMYKAGVLQGKGGGVFDPKANATRAEVATMFMNFSPIVKK